MDRGAWWAVVHGVAKSRTQLRDFTLTFHLHALEKEMATHSSVLAWRIPGTGEPGGLPSQGSQSRTGLKWLTACSLRDVYMLFKGCFPGLRFTGGSDGKESTCNAGDLSSIPGSGRSSRHGNEHPLQYFCLENSMDRGPSFFSNTFSPLAL